MLGRVCGAVSEYAADARALAKVNTMSEREADAQRRGKQLARMSSGNVEFRTVLREATRLRAVWQALRADVVAKVGILHGQRGRDLSRHLETFTSALTEYARVAGSACAEGANKMASVVRVEECGWVGASLRMRRC